MKTMKKYFQPATEIIDLQTLDICQGVGSSLYGGSVTKGDPSQALSPARWPGVGTYTTRTLYI